MSLPLTEQQNPLSAQLDTQSIAEIVALMNAEDLKVVEAVKRAQPSIVATIERIVRSFEAGGRLFYIGAGTSGRLGVLDASECPPTFRTPPDMVQGLIAGGPVALASAVEGAEDRPEAAEEDLKQRHLRREDMVVGIAASGHTPYVRAGLRYAHALGCATALLTCNDIPTDDAAVDEFMLLLVGPEVLSGSTRLKAGTATKMVLNMLTTVSMVQLGKVYDNLMVDVNISNAKLKRRARRIVQQLTSIDSDADADVLLERAGGEVKTALLMQPTGLDADAARAALAEHGGHLRQALQAFQGGAS